jgi:hypothetical protein
MSSCNEIQKVKDRIRRRDSRRYTRNHVCMLCGGFADEIHHIWYSDKYDEKSFCEACAKCHRTVIH